MGKLYDYMREDILETRRKISNGQINRTLEEELSDEDFMEGLREILDKALINGDWGGCLQDIYKEIADEIDDDIEEKVFFNETLKRLGGLIGDINCYIYDLWADVYLGGLRADSEYDLWPDNQMKLGWDSKACNSRTINMENAKRHYPMVDYGDKDFPYSGIPGGCKDYHSLMMLQKNIGLFDTDSKKESLKQYAYPKSHEFYRELADTSVENLLLLEKTLGIGYVNFLFPYIKDISSKNQLEGIRKIIEGMAEIPMFIRKGITDVICNYLVHFEYSDASVKCIEKAVDPLAYIIKGVYKKLWHFTWQAYECGRLLWRAMKGTLTELWKGYFSENEVYDYFLQSMNLCGWRDVENVEMCFTRCGENMKTLLPIDKRGQKIADVLAEKQERMQYFGGNIGEEESGKTGEEVIQAEFNELKMREDAVWEGVDPKRATKKLTPLDVYAVVHEYVIRVLNS